MKSLPPILAAFSLVVLLLGGYVGAYLGLGKSEAFSAGDYAGDDYPEVPVQSPFIRRSYPRKLLLTVFTPAAWAESHLRGCEVRAIYRDPHGRHYQEVEVQ